MAGISVETVFTIEITDKSVGALRDALTKLLEAGVPENALMSNAPASVTIRVSDPITVDKVSKALGRPTG